MSKWIDFVKDWAKKHNMNYAKALKDPKMKEAYKSPKMKGGATKEQRSNASLLRGRMKNEDTKRALNAIVHSADIPADLKDWTKKLGFRNHYVDYTNSPDIVDDPTLPNPTEILNKAFKEYFDNLDKTSPEQMFNNPHLFPADGFFIPAHFMPRWEANVRRLQTYIDTIPDSDEEEEEEEETPASIEETMDAEAFWTDPNDPRVKQWAILDRDLRLGLPDPSLSKEEKQQLKDDMTNFMETEILPFVRAYNMKYAVKDGNNPRADYSAIKVNLKTKLKNFIQFPVRYAGLKIEGKGMKIKHL